MNCTISWTDDLAAYREKFATLQHTTLLQSPDYALALGPLYGQRPRWGIVLIEGRQAGLVQLLEARALGMHAVLLDRGPLWLPGFGTEENFQSFTREFARQFPRRFARRRRFIPEIADSPSMREFFTAQKFRSHGKNYETIRVDLRLEEEALRANLRGNWRGTLKKAERANLEVSIDDKGHLFPALLSGYLKDKAARGYDGPSPQVLQALQRIFGGNALVVTAGVDKRMIAAILVLIHGPSATYQVGWTTDEGRNNSASHLLLWRAMLHLKERGINDFDLGGINDDSAAGVKTFKEGLGGTLVSLPGLYT